MTAVSPAESGVAYYEANAEAFRATVEGRAPVGEARWLADKLSPASLVVDAGCGIGVDAAWMAGQGLRVYAYDASLKMAWLTSKRLEKIQAPLAPIVRCHRHDQLRLTEPAAGVLASASLLFLPEQDLRLAMRALAAALAPGGWLVASFKRGSAPRPQPDGRVYFDRMPSDLQALAKMAGLRGVEVWETDDLLGRSQPWVTFVLQKEGQQPEQLAHG